MDGSPLPYSDDDDDVSTEEQSELPQPKDVDKIYDSIGPAEFSQDNNYYFDNNPVEVIIEDFKTYITLKEDIYIYLKREETLANITTVKDCLNYISESLDVFKKNINEQVVDFNEKLKKKKNNDLYPVPSEEDFKKYIKHDSTLISEYKKHQIVFERLVKRLKSVPTASVVSPIQIDVTPAGGSSEKTVKKPDIDSTSNDIPSVVSPENTRQITLKGGKIITITDFKLITDGASGVIDGKRFTVTRTSGVMAGGKRGVKKSRKRKPSRRL